MTVVTIGATVRYDVYRPRLRAGAGGPPAGRGVSAFDEAYAQFNSALFNFLARLSRRRDVAEDLLEETWLRFVAKA